MPTLDSARLDDELELILNRGGDGVLQGVVEYLRRKYPKYSWVGIYMLDGGTLVLVAWSGSRPTEHTKIPIGVGICGLAARTAETVIVDDVSKDSRYLACFPETKSEIVVPIIREGKVLGEIDIDGEEIGAFGPWDKAFLEVLASRLGRMV
ncbi:MAG: GAF domain-containing protein [Thermoprotei archaeon]